jgi:hypothetical protein
MLWSGTTHLHKPTPILGATPDRNTSMGCYYYYYHEKYRKNPFLGRPQNVTSVYSSNQRNATGHCCKPNGQFLEQDDGPLFEFTLVQQHAKTPKSPEQSVLAGARVWWDAVYIIHLHAPHWGS